METYQWTAEIVEKAILDCKMQSIYPFKALVLLDGLDELEDNRLPLLLLLLDLGPCFLTQQIMPLEFALRSAAHRVLPCLPTQ